MEKKRNYKKCMPEFKYEHQSNAKGMLELDLHIQCARKGNDIYWNVFAIKDDRIVPRNTITAHPETDY